MIRSLKELRDAGNSVIVVEHDEEMIRSADYVVDVGPRAGMKGGHIVAVGTPAEVEQSDSLTADYLTGRRSIPMPERLREGNGEVITLRGATGNNLKNVTVSFPLGKFICVTGVSGSGKSSIVNETLRPILSRELYRSLDQPLPYESIEGVKISISSLWSISRPLDVRHEAILRPIRECLPISANCSRRHPTLRCADSRRDDSRSMCEEVVARSAEVRVCRRSR